MEVQTTEGTTHLSEPLLVLRNLVKPSRQHLLLPDLAYARPARLAVATEGVRIPDALPLYGVALGHPKLDFLPPRVDLSFHAFCELLLKRGEVIGKRGRRESKLGMQGRQELGL